MDSTFFFCGSLLTCSLLAVYNGVAQALKDLQKKNRSFGHGRLHSDFFKGMERYILKYGGCTDKTCRCSHQEKSNVR